MYSVLGPTVADRGRGADDRRGLFHGSWLETEMPDRFVAAVDLVQPVASEPVNSRRIAGDP
jgi:hypothetical protein